MQRILIELRWFAGRNIGFAFFLAWSYIALYGCSLASGGELACDLECVRLVSGMAAAACGIVGLAIGSRVRRCSLVRVEAIAASSAVAGSIALWAAYALHWTFACLSWVAGILVGAAMVSFAVVWGRALTSCNESRIEFDVVAAFVVAFFLYFVTLPVELGGIPGLLVECALPVASVLFARREVPGDPDAGLGSRRVPAGFDAQGERDRRMGPARSALLDDGLGLRGALVMVFSLWFMMAYFRVVDAPVGAADRVSRYLLSFSIGFAVMLVLFIVLIRMMRHVNITIAYRWFLPFAMLGLAILCLGGWSQVSQIMAYAAIHAGMFGVQVAFWIAFPKLLRRRGGDAGVVFCLLTVAEGIGVAVGCAVGIRVASVFAAMGLMGPSLVVLTVGAALTMASGFDPNWYFWRSRRLTEGSMAEKATAPEVPRDPEPVAAPKAPGTAASADDLVESFGREGAQILRRAYGLTEREAEVASLLICGRSRPYIRDDLGISLNTVHSHARSLLAKCGVRSQRELVDLIAAVEHGAGEGLQSPLDPGPDGVIAHQP